MLAEAIDVFLEQDHGAVLLFAQRSIPDWIALIRSNQFVLPLRGQPGRADACQDECAQLVLREAQPFVQQAVLFGQAIAEHRRVVGVDGHHDATLDVVADGVLLDR